MLYRGDYVTHNTFPSIKGYVAVVEESQVGGANKVAVLYKNDKLFWDSEDTWDLVSNVEEESDIIDVDDVDIIDVEVREVT